jgi:hypothetical protein
MLHVHDTGGGVFLGRPFSWGGIMSRSTLEPYINDIVNKLGVVVTVNFTDVLLIHVIVHPRL